MNKKDVIEKLKSIGFKEYEAKVFIVLMKGVPMSVSEIAKEANLIRNSIYDTLKSFAERGYCNEIETNTILKYQIINPEIIAGKVEKEFHELNKQKINTFTDAINELNQIYLNTSIKNEERTDNVELIRGFNKHRVAKYLELIYSAEDEILGMNRIKGLVTDEINDFAKKFTSGGGKIKSLYKISLDFKVVKNRQEVNATDEDLVKVCENFEKYGEEVRLTSIEIPNLVIIDRKKVFMNINGEQAVAKNKQSDLIINDRLVTNNMRDLFFYYWENSSTINDYKHRLINNKQIEIKEKGHLPKA